MGILTRLRLLSLFSIGMLVVLVSILSLSFTEFRSAKSNYDLANKIKINFFARSSYRDEYFLYREDRFYQQWLESDESASRLLHQATLQFRDGDEVHTVINLRQLIEESSIIFQRIVKNTERLQASDSRHDIYQELDKRLASQMLLRSAAIRNMATVLEDSSARRVEQTYKRLTVIIVLFVTTLALTTILNSALISNLIRKRLKALHDGAKIISGGKLDYRIPREGSDELTELAESINNMTEKLQSFTGKLESEIAERTQAEKLLRESETKLQAILDSSAVAVAWANEHGVIEYINRKFTLLFDYTLEDIPTVEQWYLRAYPDPDYRHKIVTAWEAEVAQSKQDGKPVAPLELAVTCKDGSIKFVILMSSWAGSRLLANFSDITERKYAEQALERESEKNLALLRNASDGIHILDTNGNVVEVSDSFCDMLGYSRDEVIGMNLSQWDAGLPEPERTRIFKQQFDNPQRSQFETRHRRKDGSIFDVEVSGFPLELDGRPVLFNSSRNISQRKQAEKELARNEANLRAILDNVPYLVWLKDTDSRFVAVNKAFLRTTGHTNMDEVIGKTDFDLWPGELAKKYRDDDLDVMDHRLQKLTEEQSINNGIVSWVETFKTPILDRNENLLGTTGFSRDITERKHAQDMVQHMAHYDTLTDLPNRVLFADRVQQALTVAKRDKCRLALMFIDLDKFKPINDELGHEVGDLLLKEVAKRMQDCMRESDTVARIGGDEFVVLLPIIEELQDALHVAEKIRQALNLPFLLAGQKLGISSSTGVAVYPEHGVNETQLMKSADIAMYHAKQGGRNSVVLYLADMQDA